MSILTETYQLHDGQKIHKVGFGTWQIPNGKQAYDSTAAALKAGYRHIDTARAYQNEESVGRAIRESGIPREEIYLTTKIPAEVKTYQGTLDAFDTSMQQLGLEYVDLLLIHAPWPWGRSGENFDKENLEVWRAMTEFKQSGRAMAIGVSNFSVKDLKNIMENSDEKPAANQIRWFVGNTQPEVTHFCKENGILVEAYSPFATGRILEDSKLQEIADKYGRSIPQICLRYCLQHEVLPLPKSTHEEYIIENSKLDFELSREDMDYLDGLDFTDV